ncbi:MAG: CHAT domain-containing protein [Nitrospirales bacterium]|nr:CHAT domain-containing protein [Nitrospirales bacterium]
MLGTVQFKESQRKMVEDRALYPELKITVQNDGTVIAEIPETGEKKEDGKIDNDSLLLEILKSFRDWLNQGKLNITLEREFEVLGGLLRRLLLENGGPGVRDLVDKKLAEARKLNRRICVQLEFQAGHAELHSLPWEFLYDPADKCFFATNINLVLTRYIPSGGVRQALSSDHLPLQMQIVVSKPQGLKSVAAEDAIKAIEQFEQFANANSERIALGKTLEGLPFLQLQDRFKILKNEGRGPHVVHFIGHGRYNKHKRQGEVALPNAKGDGADWVDQNQFTRLFTDINCIPRLLFLQLCEGAVVEEAELIASFEGLAPALLRVGVQAVVAMQFPIKNIHASEICKIFYDELTKGGSVGEAVQTARLRMVINSPVAAGTPVLYMFGFDRPIVSVSSTTLKATGDRVHARANPSAGGPSTASLGSGPNLPLPRAIQEELSNPPPSGELSNALNRLLKAGSQKIEDITKGIQTKDTPPELISLNKKLHFEVIPKLRGKTVLEMRQVLADLCQREVGTLLSAVLEEMFNAAVRMS